VNLTLTSIRGIKVGHATKGRTGCTVVLLEPEAMVAVDARGGYPTTFDTDGISIGKTYVKRHAIFLSGGDVFGLQAATGVQKYLVEKRIVAGKIPLIVGATIYDLDSERADYSSLAYVACSVASADEVKMGAIGVGAGAFSGRFAGISKASKTGVGSHSVKLPFGVKVASLAVTNCMGNIFDYRTGKIISGARYDNNFILFEDFTEQYIKEKSKEGNTTLAIVATDADLSHEELVKMARIAHNGLAMSIRPVHTSDDGDTVFAVSTAYKKIGHNRSRCVDAICYYASLSIAESVRMTATSLNGKAKYLNQR
jgi:L-aminopeptidase/D-esterase-like protein